MNKEIIKTNFIQITIILIAIIGAFILAGHVVYVQCFTDANFFDELGNKEKPFYLVNIAIVIAAISTALFTWWKNALNAEQVKVMQDQSENIRLQTLNSQKQIEALQSQIRIQEETRIDSLFSKAFELLNENNDITTRKSGIHILKDIAVTNPKHTQRCIDLLCSINELWMPWLLGFDPNFFQKNKEFLNIQNIDDIKTTQIAAPIKSLQIKMQLSQLVLKVMSQIIKEISNNNVFIDTYDLSYKYLCSISLSDVKLTKFELNHINFDNAFMFRVDLSNKLIWSSDFQHSFLIECNFENSHLPQAFFDSAKLNTVNFKNANIEDAYFLGTKFINSDIRIAKNYDKAHFNDDDIVRNKTID